MTSVDKVGRIFQTEIIDLAYDGKSVGKLDGKIIFLNGGLPGEQVEAEIIRRKARFSVGRVRSIISRSADRIDPSCSHFDICGGCTWQDLDYEKQLFFKRKQIVDSLKHIGHIENVEVDETIPSVDKFYYRNKMEFSFNSDGDDSFNLGLHHRGRYDKIFDITNCLLQSEISNKIVGWFRDFVKMHNIPVADVKQNDGFLRFLVIREGKQTGQIMVNIVTRQGDIPHCDSLISEAIENFPDIATIVQNINDQKSNIAYGESEKLLYGPGYIEEKILGCAFKIYANSFFQTNSRQTEHLYRTIFEFLDPEKTDHLLDLYCGTGTIGICAAGMVGKVIGIDSEASAIAAARENAEINKVDNATFHTGLVKEVLKQNMVDFAGVNCVVIDPPRAGLHPKALKAVLELNLEKIIFVSCNPTTFSRDAAVLIQSGYKLSRVVPVDMFPHTMHIELVGGFYKSDNK